MKWLILIIVLTSCGKHESPDPQDFSDTDGDQISNAEEERIGSNKYIAEVRGLEELKGKLNINGSEYKFSNLKDVQQDTLNLLVRRESQLKTEEYFSEFSRLRFSKGAIPKLVSETTEVLISFESMHPTDTDIYFITATEQRKIHTWSLNVRLSLTRSEINGLLDESAFIALKKTRPILLDRDEHQEDSIKNKTYRVFFSNQTIAKVIYVSKDYSYDAFKEFMEVEDALAPDTTPLLYPIDNEFTDRWYERRLPNGDIVLALSNLKTLQKTYLSGFRKSQDQVYRKNGTKTRLIALGKKEDSRLILHVRASRSVRGFNEWVTTTKHRSGGGGPNGNPEFWTCSFFHRGVSSENQVEVSTAQVKENLLISSENGPLNYEIRELADDSGIYWEVRLDTRATNLRISMNELSTGFSAVGLYQSGCSNGDGKNSGVNASSYNSEAEFVFSVESLVENLN